MMWILLTASARRGRRRHTSTTTVAVVVAVATPRPVLVRMLLRLLLMAALLLPSSVGFLLPAVPMSSSTPPPHTRRSSRALPRRAAAPAAEAALRLRRTTSEDDGSTTGRSRLLPLRLQQRTSVKDINRVGIHRGRQRRQQRRQVPSSLLMMMSGPAGEAEGLLLGLPLLLSSSSTSTTAFSNYFASMSLTISTTSAVGVQDATALVAASWSIFLMLVLVGLLTTWEVGVQRVRQSLPTALLPVLNSMLGEIGGLGFIGLLLSTFVTTTGSGAINVGSWLEQAGEQTLDDPEILTETFEFLHTAFFQVGMTYFTVAGLLVYRALQKLSKLDQVTQVAMQSDNFNCLNAMVTAAESAERIEMPTADSSSISTEDLLIRERLVRKHGLDPAQFRVENYFGSLMGAALEEMVELAPCTAWLPLVPALSQGRSIDMSHDVVSASSPNALLSSGYFVSTPGFVIVSSLFATGTLVWGTWNHWKMQQIKCMVLPTLQSGAVEDGSAIVTMVDPPYTDPKQLASFDSSPGVLGWVEAAVSAKLFPEEEGSEGTEAEDPSRHEGTIAAAATDVDLTTHQRRKDRQLQLFGNAGRSGPELYLRSIQFHTWLVTTQLVFWGTQIVARDVSALSSIFAVADAASTIGRPEYVGWELALYGSFVAAAMFQLLVWAPQTFWNYILVTSVEELAQPDVLRASCCDIGILRRDEGDDASPR